MIKYYNAFCPNLYISIHDTPAYILEEYEFKNDENIFLDLINDSKNRKKKWLRSDKIALLIEKLYSEIIENFPPKEYLDRLKKRKQIILWRWQVANGGKRSLSTKANLLELGLENKTENKKELTFYENCVRLEQALNSPIDSRKITIFEYRNKLKVIANNNGNLKTGT